MNAAAVATFWSNHAADWAEGIKIGSRDTNIYKEGHDLAHGGLVPHVGYAPWLLLSF